MARVALGQSKMVTRPVAGILHVLVYAGFVIIADHKEFSFDFQGHIYRIRVANLIKVGNPLFFYLTIVSSSMMFCAPANLSMMNKT
jgi:hypothetical protein